MSEVATASALSVDDARRLTERIRYTALSVRDGMEKLQRLVQEAKDGSVHVALGFASWTAYLSETLGSEPLRLARDDRQALVGYLAGEGMSTRAIAPIVGVHHDTVASDLKAAPVGNPTPEPEVEPVPVGYVDTTTGEVTDAPPAPAPEPRPTVVGLDGKAYHRPEPAAPRTPARRSLIDTARDVGQDLRKVTERLERITTDDRFTRNKNEVAAHLRHHLAYAIKVCQDLDRSIN